MADTLRLEIVTPDAVVFSEEVEMVTLPCIQEELGIYPMHVRVITQVVPGQIVAIQGGREQLLAVGAGLVEITGRTVSIVTDMAIPADRIDEAKVEAARAHAEARLREKISDEEVATVNATLVRALAQLQVRKRKRR